MTQEAEILEGLAKSILDLDAESAVIWAEKALAKGIPPVKAVETLTEAIRQVGDAFGRGEIFLPELIMAAEAMKKATPLIEAAMDRAGEQRKSSGVLVIGSVAGDIHDIGKAIVAALFEAAGFVVIDLGVDIPEAKFVEAVKQHKPDLLGLSALLSTTAPQQKAVIESLIAAGIRDSVKIIVGGGAITQSFADEIGADGYGASAPEGVKMAKKLLGIG